MTKTILYSVITSFLSLPYVASAGECSSFSGRSINKLACEDATSARFLSRLAKAQKALEKVSPPGARPAFRSHQAKWELFADAWLAPAVNNSASATAANYPRCASPRALLFQRMDSLEKAVTTIKDTKPKTIDLCYDNASCLEPGATNSEMICETIHLGVEGVPASAEPLIISLLGDWVAKGHAFETHINKSTRNAEPCEIIQEKSLVEYLRGGFATVRTRQGDTCNPQNSNEQVQTFDLRTGRALKISDFVTSPAELLALLRKRKEADVLQALLKHQLKGDKTRPRIEPSECSELPFSTLADVNVHVTSDGLRINKLFKKTTPETAPCQFKVEEGVSPAAVGQLLKGKSTPASGMLKYIR